MMCFIWDFFLQIIEKALSSFYLDVIYLKKNSSVSFEQQSIFIFL